MIRDGCFLEREVILHMKKTVSRWHTQAMTQLITTESVKNGSSHHDFAIWVWTVHFEASELAFWLLPRWFVRSPKVPYVDRSTAKGQHAYVSVNEDKLARILQTLRVIP